MSGTMPCCEKAMTEPIPPRSFPFSREIRNCARCGAVTFYIHYDGRALCPKHRRELS
jgi:hypothetical protein